MKCTPIALCAVLAIASTGAANGESADGLSVGVGPYVGREALLVSLANVRGLEPVALDELSAPSSLARYQVVVCPLERLSSNDVERRLLRDYVEGGGGLVLVRDPDAPSGDAVRDQPPLPEIAGILPRTWRYDRTVLYRVADPDHPLGKALPSRLELPPYDHLILDPGPNGTILMLSEDADTAMVAGELGKGRVVILGYAPGYRKTARKAALEPGEGLILGESVRWASSEIEPASPH